MGETGAGISTDGAAAEIAELSVASRTGSVTSNFAGVGFAAFDPVFGSGNGAGDGVAFAVTGRPAGLIGLGAPAAEIGLNGVPGGFAGVGAAAAGNFTPPIASGLTGRTGLAAFGGAIVIGVTALAAFLMGGGVTVFGTLGSGLTAGLVATGTTISGVFGAATVGAFLMAEDAGETVPVLAGFTGGRPMPFGVAGFGTPFSIFLAGAAFDLGFSAGVANTGGTAAVGMDASGAFEIFDTAATIVFKVGRAGAGLPWVAS
jgi:hypothetical protein